MKFRILVLFILTWVCSASIAEVVENLEYKFYRVPLEPGASLSKAIDAVTPFNDGGRKYHGFTKWKIAWNYRYDKQVNGSCKITTVSVKLNANITLPELISNDETANNHFKTYLSALKTHELGHLKIAQETAKKIEQSMLMQEALSDCHLLETALNARGNALISDANVQDKQYDAETKHGKTQGALLRD